MQNLIPIAPQVPRIYSKQQNCKIVIATGKLNEGYCIVGDELNPGPRPGYFMLPGSPILIDKMNANLFQDPDIKAFVAVPKLVGSNTVKIDNKILYVLHPLKKTDYDRYENKEMDEKEVEIKYTIPKIKAEGTFGKVEFHETSGIAVKYSKVDVADLPQDMLKEIGIYRLLREIACLPKLFGFNIGALVKLEFELGTGTLEDAIIQRKMSLKDMHEIMFRMTKCLRSSASQGLIHCDLKPLNCIVSKQGKVQIIDWGASEIDNTKGQTLYKNTIIQTLWWRSPEILMLNLKNKQDGQYTNKIDIFSLGLIFAEIYAGRPPVNAKDATDQARTILRVLLDYDRTKLDTPAKIKQEFELVVTGPSVANKIKQMLLTSSRFIDKDTDPPMPEIMADLISNMLEINPVHRWTYDQIVLHPLFQDIRRESIPKLPIFINNMPVTDLNFWKGDLNIRMRKILFSWMSDVVLSESSFKLRQSIEVFCSALQLVDLLIMKKQDISRNKLQAYACACFIIASKLHSNNNISVETMVFFSENSPDEIIDFERTVMTILNGNVLVPSLYTYVSHYMGEEKLSIKNIYKYRDIYERPDIYSKQFSEKIAKGTARWQELLK